VILFALSNNFSVMVPRQVVGYADLKVFRFSNSLFLLMVVV
jgi:hypothetical protein